MSLACVYSGAVCGVDAVPVEVEVNASEAGKVEFIKLVGLPDAAVRESLDRVVTAIRNSGLRWPNKPITINLAPADLRKEGPSFDLPIAVGMVSLAQEQNGPLGEGALGKCAMVGELALDGRVRPIKGVLPLTLRAKQQGLRAIFVPKENAVEASIVQGIYVYGIESLRDAYGLLAGEGTIKPERLDREAFFSAQRQYPIDFDEVKGQAHAKRALEVAMAGGHNLLPIIHFTTKRTSGISPSCPTHTPTSGSPRRTRFMGTASADKRNWPELGARRTRSLWSRITVISGSRRSEGRMRIRVP